MKRSKSNRIIAKPEESEDALVNRLLTGLEELSNEERKQVFFKMGDGASFAEASKAIKALRV